MSSLEIVEFRRPKEWAAWLERHHASSPGVQMRFAKKGSAKVSITHDEAVEEALCYGWIDGQTKSESEETWLQRFTPRSRTSIWSKINREKAMVLIESAKMRPAGLAEIERAKGDGRWDRAYDSPKASTVPPDLQKALDENAAAKEFFATLNGQNRYAVLFRVQTAKKPETRARRIQQFVAMLARHEKLHP